MVILMLLYRLLLVVNMGISAVFMFDPSVETVYPSTFSERLYPLQMGFLLLLVLMFVGNIIIKKALSTRVILGVVYVLLSYWTTEITFHWLRYPEIWSTSLSQTIFFVSEVICFAVLCKNDFKKIFFFYRS